ncbi:hypothetical protein CBL_04145 [Carabus blaptoides fortunei]
MVRTKTSGVSGVKSLGAKAPRKLSLSSSNSRNKNKRDSNSQGGGNSIHPRETPQWQQPITSFFGQNSGTQENGNTIQDDDENIITIDDQKDNVPPLENDERNTKRKKDQGRNKDERIDSEEEGIAIKKIKLSIEQTDSDATP